MNAKPFEYFAVGPLPIKRLTTDQVLDLARRAGSIRRVQRKWSIAKESDGTASLAPLTGARYLYRGQTARHRPSFPLVSRASRKPGRCLHELSLPDALGIVANMARADWFASELNAHPIFAWARDRGLNLPAAELAQHYGVPTFRMDMSESVEVALFFATHELRDGEMRPRTQGTAILYRVDRKDLPEEAALRFRPISILPFARPFRQWAWVCELALGECFESCPGLVAIEFEHSESLANSIRELAERDGPLFPSDPMTEIASQVCQSITLPENIVETVLRDVCSSPAGLPAFSVPDLKSALTSAGYLLSGAIDPLVTPLVAQQLHLHWNADWPSWEATLVAGYEQVFVRTNDRGTLDAVSLRRDPDNPARRKIVAWKRSPF